MRKAVLAAILLAVLTIMLPRFAAQAAKLPQVQTKDDEETEPVTQDEPADEEAESPQEDKTAELSDSARTVTALIGGEHCEMSLRDYLIGVVAAEMPASFETEALTAQAIAARTYTLYKQTVSPSQNHAEDVCDDINCCKAYITEDTMALNWGEDYESYYAKISAAVDGSDGQIMTWEDEPILAVFHSSSGGYTESSENVWGGALPYLVSVESPETAQEVPNFVTEVKLSAEEFSAVFCEAHPEAQLEGAPEEWFSSMSYTGGGRLGSIMVGGVPVSGTELRKLYGLRSADIALRVINGEISFRVVGYGHGAGMSQYGANVMAQDGADAQTILEHYYPGAVLTELT